MNLFVFGLGYTASHFVARHRADFEAVAATVRSPERLMPHHDRAVFRFDGNDVDPRLEDALAASDVLLASVQPDQGYDPVLARFGDEMAASPRLRAITYLSTIGVYGDHDGAWIDESAETQADNPRQDARIAAEQTWIELGRRTGKTVTILRLAGIYGPSRNALHDLRTGHARRIDKPGQVFNRIHVADIGRAIAAALRYEGRQSLFNVTDDEPAPAPDVVAHAAGLLGVEPPPLIPFASADLSPMARSFYSANRRVENTALKDELGVRLAYPTYREGLAALLAEGEGRA